jgi:hypothetical protein
MSSLMPFSKSDSRVVDIREPGIKMMGVGSKSLLEKKEPRQ